MKFSSFVTTILDCQDDSAVVWYASQNTLRCMSNELDFNRLWTVVAVTATLSGKPTANLQLLHLIDVVIIKQWKKFKRKYIYKKPVILYYNDSSTDADSDYSDGKNVYIYETILMYSCIK